MKFYYDDYYYYYYWLVMQGGYCGVGADYSPNMSLKECFSVYQINSMKLIKYHKLEIATLLLTAT